MEIQLDFLKEVRDLYVSIKSNKGDDIEHYIGDIGDDINDWTYVIWNIGLYGFDHEDLVKYLEYGIKPEYWKNKGEY